MNLLSPSLCISEKCWGPDDVAVACLYLALRKRGRGKSMGRLFKLFLRKSLYYIYSTCNCTWNRCSKLAVIPNVNVSHVFNCQLGAEVFVWLQCYHFLDNLPRLMRAVEVEGCLTRTLQAACVSPTFPFYLEQLQASNSNYNNSIMGWQQSSNKSYPWQINSPPGALSCN